MSDMNVTPLIDVVLVLLVVFMVVTPMIEAGLPVELPPVQKYEDEKIVKTADEAKYIIISVAGPEEEGTDAPVRWGVGGQQATNDQELLALINEEIAKDEQNYNEFAAKARASADGEGGERPHMRGLLIKGDRTLEYGQVREVMNIISDGGWGTMQLAVDQGS